MKNKLLRIDSKWKEYALAGCITVICFLVLSNLGKIFSSVGTFLRIFESVFTGFIIAYILNPLAVFFNNKLLKGVKKEKIRWILSVAITLVLVIAIVVGLVLSLIPQLIESVAVFTGNIGTYMDHLAEIAAEISTAYGDVLNEYTDRITSEGGLLEKASEVLTENLGKILKTTGNIGTKATTWFIGFIFTFYFLLSKDSILSSIRKLSKLALKPLNYTRASIFIEKFNSIFSRYIVCEILDSLLVGILNFMFMMILRMPNALFISVVCGVTNLAPTFGPIIGLVIADFILLLVEPGCVLAFTIFTLVLQTMDGYVIKPKLFGGALNVPGFFILIAIIVFGKLMGVAGMLIAIPIAAIVVYLYDSILIPYLELRKELQQYDRESGKETEKNG